MDLLNTEDLEQAKPEALRRLARFLGMTKEDLENASNELVKYG
jgi:hypothetical protein